jgi:hypothetical protein
MAVKVSDSYGESHEFEEATGFFTKNSELAINDEDGNPIAAFAAGSWAVVALVDADAEV